MKIRRDMMISDRDECRHPGFWFVFTRCRAVSRRGMGALSRSLSTTSLSWALVSTLFPTLLLLSSSGLWRPSDCLYGLDLIQFVVGSYIEPRASGRPLSMSPVMVCFVFLWGYLWGIFGAFIGGPITIALLTFCNQHPVQQVASELFVWRSQPTLDAQRIIRSSSSPCYVVSDCDRADAVPAVRWLAMPDCFQFLSAEEKTQISAKPRHVPENRSPARVQEPKARLRELGQDDKSAPARTLPTAS